jgi:transcriptional repressor NrdR
VPALSPTLESSGETEVPSGRRTGHGDAVYLDQVAYIRFASASVYRNFREAKDFGESLRRIAADDD